MALGCDTATRVTAARLKTLKDYKMTFVGRYLNRVEGAHDELTTAEVDTISDGGLFIVSIYEKNGATKQDYFTNANGVSDATDAVKLAGNLGQPNGTPIYFTVDTRDWTTQEIKDKVVPYFQGVLSVLNNSSKNPHGYKMGIYGSRAVCSYIRGAYSATERYTFIVDSWPGTFDDWNLRQYKYNTDLGTDAAKIKVDYVESSSNGGGGWKK
ncbi:glycoside hydrolase domain-containing protein [Paenibacillus sp. FSL W8-0194]|uniref:glycoside hydrolase domain-containing protein n=1 Tax=Paenibacillus sp. FSL W8-0194 TaxID=2921711 RepID=UPI0030DC98E7